MSSLKYKFISGVTWATFERITFLTIQFIVSIIIARKLTPEDFGVIGLLIVFIALGKVILDSGFSHALIQKKDATNIDFSTIFYFNLLIGIVLYGLLYTLCPFIAKFYNIPELSIYARVLFLIIPISSLAIIQNVILQKKLDFRKIAIVNISSSLLSGVIGIYTAYNGAGIMSLVYQQISAQLLSTLLFICINRWIPLLSFSIRNIKELAAFSINLLLTSSIAVIFANLYTIIIGRFFQPSAVGFYTQARRFEGIAATTITDIVLKVSFPLFVNHINNLNHLKSIYRKVVLLCVFIVCPIMGFIIISGEELFYILLTEKWLPAVPYLQLLCLIGMMLPLHRINTNIFKVLKAGKTILNLEIARNIIIILSIILTIRHSINALLIGQFISVFIIIIITMHYSGRLINYNVFTQIRDVIPSYLITIVTAIITKIIIDLMPLQPIVVFSLKALCMAGLYITLSFFFNYEPFSYIVETITYFTRGKKRK